MALFSQTNFIKVISQQRFILNQKQSLFIWTSLVP